MILETNKKKQRNTYKLRKDFKKLIKSKWKTSKNLKKYIKNANKLF